MLVGAPSLSRSHTKLPPDGFHKPWPAMCTTGYPCLQAYSSAFASAAVSLSNSSFCMEESVSLSISAFPHDIGLSPWGNHRSVTGSGTEPLWQFSNPPRQPKRPSRCDVPERSALESRPKARRIAEPIWQGLPPPRHCVLTPAEALAHVTFHKGFRVGVSVSIRLRISDRISEKLE